MPPSTQFPRSSKFEASEQVCSDITLEMGDLGVICYDLKHPAAAASELEAEALPP